jgi:replication factor C large subunit
VSRVVKLTKVPVQSIEKRLRDICARENVKTDPEALKTLARFSQGDLRSAITDLQMAAKGRSSLTVKDLESAGYRDRPSAVFEVLPKVFRSGSPQAAAKAMSGSDKPPEELFLWIESNLALEYSGPNLARAAEILARADIFLSQIVKQRNYRFRRYMLDVLSGLALIPPAGGSFVLYKPPDKLIMMGRSRASRALMSSLCKKIGAVTHSSAKGVRRDYLPYLKILMKKEKVIEGIQLTPEELTMLKS